MLLISVVALSKRSIFFAAELYLCYIFQRRTGSGGNFLFYKAGFPYELNPNFIVHDFQTLSLFVLCYIERLEQTCREL